MDEDNIKLILKNELKYKMNTQTFKEIIRESNINNNSLSKNESIELLFKECSLNQITDMILNKYKDKGDSHNYKRLFDRINGLSVDERRALARKKEIEKRGKPVYSPTKNFRYMRYNAYYETDNSYYNDYFDNF